MTDLTPNPKQLQYWIDKISYPHSEGVGPSSLDEELACLAYRAGADYELEKCCEWLRSQHHSDTWPNRIRAARRPKPPIEAEQALEAVDRIDFFAVHNLRAYKIHSDLKTDIETICRALERLKELEEIK